ncbi:acyltransferase [Bacteroides sp. AM07-16]|nr:acyltransferase [Bacteroides sp. AM07-16]
MGTQQKVPSIETLRGLAILLVVIGHVIGSTPEGGMKIDYPSPWRYLYLWIDYIQMPLFTAIAGWVYAIKPIQKDSLGNFFKKKFYRLLIPMAVAATLYFLVQYITPGTNNKGYLSEIWRIYIFPYTIYWYLPSLFIMFTCAAVIDIRGWASRIQNWTTCIIVTYIGVVILKEVIPSSIPNLFSFKGAIALFPYFIIGMGANRFSGKLFITDKQWGVYAIFALIGIVLLQLEWFYPLAENNLYQRLQPIWIMALLLLLLHQKHSNKILIWLGNYAYVIYLYHGFGTSGGRILLSWFGIHSEIPVFLFALSIAIIFPVIIGKLGQKWRLTRTLILGIK